MIKLSFFHGADDRGVHVVPLFGPADSFFEKTAAPALLPEVTRYIASLRPRKDAQYVLLNAMGAGEWWGSNVNGDYFSEASLIHAPNDWTGNPLLDREKSKDWAYGYPTFYNASPFAHHRNKDATKAFGEVELAAWNPRMKRVELVTRLDEDKCQKFGGQGVWDKLRAGEYTDVSMGCRVPYDTCFPAGTLVRTEQGNKPIEKVVVGERVVTHMGSCRRVTQTMQRTAEGLLTLTASGLPEISSTENHPFLVLRKEQARTCKGSANGQRLRHSFREGSATCPRCGKLPKLDLVWAAAETIKPGDYLAVPAQKQSVEQYIALPQARLLGYYLGDGYILKQRRGKKKDGAYYDTGFGFSGGTAEEAHLERLLSTIVEAGAQNDPCVYDAGCDQKAWIVSVYDQELGQWLQTCGGRTSHGKRLLEEVYYWSKEAKLEVVAGYIDTDGSFDGPSGMVRICSVNKGLLLDVQRLLLSIGVVATVSRHAEEGAGGYANSSAAYALVLSAFEAQEFYGRATKVEKRDVSWASPQSFFWEGYWLTPVKSVTETEGDVDVFNLSVEVDESYLAEGRAAHNCSICLDWKLYREAQETFDPAKDKSPGDAVLAFHKKRLKDTGHGIRGVSITRKDYCEHALRQMNHILSDGRKVFVYNDYPKFFDISFVFVGADKTAKVMMKIAGAGQSHWYLNGAELAEKLGYVSDEDLSVKVASVEDVALKHAFLGKAGTDKDAEIVKDIVPSQFAAKAIPALTRSESDLPAPLLDALGVSPLEEALSTPSALGMVLRPREFQRIILICSGNRALADDLDDKGVVFPKTNEKEEVPLSPASFSPLLAKLLAPFMGGRSAFGPSIEKRVLVSGSTREEKRAASSSLSSELLRKIGAAYNGYRTGVMDLVTHAQDFAANTPGVDASFNKLASTPVDSLITPLTAQYLKLAFWDEVGPACIRQRGEGESLSRNTWPVKTSGGY